MRAIIIGSGIGGLCCAIGLQRIGLEVILYERAPELREVGAGIMLWANALRALDALGVGDAVRAVALRASHMMLACQNGRKTQLTAEAQDFETDLGYAPFASFVHRADLVGALASHLPAGVARYGQECIGVEARGQRVAATFASGHSDEADLLIGADGIRSAVRQALFGPTELRYAGYTCWRGICPRLDSIRPGEVRLWTGRGSQVGINTLTDDRIYWFATRNAPPGGKAPDERAEALGRFGDWAEPFPALIASTPADRVLRADIFDRPPSRPWSKGNALLIGDAAHPTTPNFGQGGGMAIEDGVVLARCLTAFSEPAAAFAAFEAERYPRTSAVTEEAWRFGKMLQWESRASVWLRDLLSGIAMRLQGTNQLIKHARYNVGTIPATRGVGVAARAGDPS